MKLSKLTMMVFGGMAMLSGTPLLASDGVVPTIQDINHNPFWYIAPAGAIVALMFAWKFFREVKRANPGDEKMQEIAQHVTDGAMAYLKRQYKVVAIFFVVVSAILFVMGKMGLQHEIVFIAFLTGGFFSGLCGYIGMKTATHIPGNRGMRPILLHFQ